MVGHLQSFLYFCLSPGSSLEGQGGSGENGGIHIGLTRVIDLILSRVEVKYPSKIFGPSY